MVQFLTEQPKENINYIIVKILLRTNYKKKKNQINPQWLKDRKEI